MELKWGHLSADAKMYDGLFDVLQMFTHFYIEPGKPLTLPTPTYLCLSFRAHQNEIQPGQSVPVELQLRDSFGGKYSSPKTAPLIWCSINPGYPLIGQLKYGLLNWQIPKPGQYYFHTRIGGKPVGKVGLTVLPTAGAGARPYTGPRTGFKVEWAHVTDHIEAYDDGLVSLYAISDFMVLPKHVDFALFSAELVVQLSGGPDDEPDHEIEYVLVDSDDKPQGTPLVRKLSGRQVQAGGRWYYSDGVRVQNAMLEGGHDYTFRISVDGTRLPDGVEYRVLKADDFQLEIRSAV